MKRETCPACGRAKPGPKSNPARDAKILRLYDKGLTLDDIGTQMKLSRQRVSAIVKKAYAAWEAKS